MKNDEIFSPNNLHMSKIFSNFVAHFVRIALTRIYDEISDQKIIMAIKENPKITRAELQNITGLSESGVKKILMLITT